MFRLLVLEDENTDKYTVVACFSSRVRGGSLGERKIAVANCGVVLRLLCVRPFSRVLRLALF